MQISMPRKCADSLPVECDFPAIVPLNSFLFSGTDKPVR
jgi:hypothetical protein